MSGFIEAVKEMIKRTSHVYIFGGGLYGRNMFKILADNNINVDGFLVTKLNNNDSSLFNLPVLEAASIIDKNDIGIILGLGKENSLSVIDYLKSNNFNMNNVIINNEFLRSGEQKQYIDKRPLMEITTAIGCKVNCLYCPQRTLIQNYGNAERMMSLKTFNECLEKLPSNCDISFCGMAEPFLNPQCNEMIKEAIDRKHRVEVFTTLVGATEKSINQLLSLDIDYFVLHVADKYGYAKIQVSDEYYRTVERVVNCKKSNGDAFVNLCSAQEEADEKIKQICAGKCEILSVLHNRAGNLEGDNLMSRSILQGKLKCSMCGSAMNRNVLLPDGRVLLCCNDYGMKHILGNLVDETYEEIMEGKEMMLVKQGMLEDFSDILCRKCQAAILLDTWQ